MKTILILILTLTVGLIACDKQATAESQAHQSKQHIEQTSAAAVAPPATSAEPKHVDTHDHAESSAIDSAPLGPQAFVEGTHYKRTANPVPKANPDKDEVVEVFWYGCIHCFKFEPVINTWKKNKPADAEFVAVPAVWNERLALHAKMYYAAKQMKLLGTMHDKIFTAMNVERKQFANADEIADFFVENGVDREEFLAVLNSFSINSQVAAAGAKVRDYGIEGTPEMIVNGRYRTTAKLAGGQQNMIKVVDYLLTLD